MADQFIDEVVQTNAPIARAMQRAPIELVEGEGGRATPIDAAGTIVNEVDDVATSGARVLPESVKARFAEIRAARAAGREVEVEEDDDAPPGETAAESAAANGEVADPTAIVKPADPAAVVPAIDPHAEYKTQIARYEAANQQLLSELDDERKKPRDSEDVKLLREASTAYLEDSENALRKFVAASLGVTDPAAPEVDAELRLIYGDLTAKMLGVTPDEAHQAKRDAARARQLWARENRQRKAEEQSNSDKATRDAEAKAEEGAATYIGTQLGTKASDYPLLTNLSQVFDGVPAGTLVWKVIQRETKAGRIDPKTQSDEQMIAIAARKIEDHYTGLLAKANQAIPKPNPSTATPSGNPPPAANKSASPDQRQSPAARTLTTADASVAPATPPAQKPKPKDDKPPEFKNDDERKKWAMRHLRKRRA